jgi:Domain of unknown function (DUF4440)
MAIVVTRPAPHRVRSALSHGRLVPAVSTIGDRVGQAGGMSRHVPTWLILVALCGAACTAASAAPQPATRAGAETEVRARERAWLDAYEKPDPGVMADVLADGFLITFPDGGQMDKAAVVASARRPRGPDDRPPRFTTRSTVARARDGVIILIGEVIDTRVDRQGQPREQVSSYTDTWVREGKTWRVLASHLSAATGKRVPATPPTP